MLPQRITLSPQHIGTKVQEFLINLETVRKLYNRRHLHVTNAGSELLKI